MGSLLGVMEMANRYRVRIGQGRRVTLPKEFVAALKARPGDYFVFDVDRGVFSLADGDSDSTELEEDIASLAQELGDIPLSQIGRATVVSKESAQKGRVAYRANLDRTKSLVAQCFAGLGVPPEILARELANLTESTTSIEETGETQEEPRVQESETTKDKGGNGDGR